MAAHGSFVLATRNAHKLAEFRRLLEPVGISVQSLPNEVELAPENARTFQGNALPKARCAAAATNCAALADDSGIESEVLGGAPGVRSARYAGARASDAQNVEKLVRDIPAGSALRYVCALAYVDPRTGRERVFIGDCRGRLADTPRGSRGFGYDPVFLPDADGQHRTMAELTERQKDAISHRGNAVRALIEWLCGQS